MSTEKLRLEAEMKDNASPVVRRLKKELDSIRATPGMQEATKWLGKFQEGAEGFVKSGGNAGSVINAMGIGGLTAAASVATLVAQFKELGERTLAMKELGREVGLTVDQVNAFAHAGLHFGVTADTMQGALNHLTSQMPEFRRGLGPMFQELSRWPELIAKLKKEGTDDQIKDIFAFLGQQKFQAEPQLQKQVLGAIFGSGDEMEKLFGQGAKGFLDELDKQTKSLGTISPEMLKQSQDFRDSTIAFNDALQRFELTTGPKFLGIMTAIVDKATQFFNPDPDRYKKQRAGGAADERDSLSDLSDPRVQDALKSKKSPYGGLDAGAFHKSSYSERSSGLLHRTSFGDASPASAFGLEATIASGTKTGVLAAFREMMAGRDIESGAGGGSGLIQASYGGAGFGRSQSSALRGLRQGAGGHPALRGSARSGVDDYLDQKTVKGLTDGQTRNYEDILGQRESGNRYGITNPYGFAGRWQFGAGALQENGYLKAGKLHGNGAMRDPSWWTGKGGAHSMSDWLGNKNHVQDRAMLEYTSRHYDQLLAAGVPLDRMSPEQRAGFLAAAHLKGVGGAIALYHGKGSFDANGTSTGSYFGMMRGVGRDRRATGLGDASGSTGAVPAAPGGNIRADIHVHGNPHRTTIKATGSVQANLHRWPTMTEASDQA